MYFPPGAWDSPCAMELLPLSELRRESQEAATAKDRAGDYWEIGSHPLKGISGKYLELAKHLKKHVF